MTDSSDNRITAAVITKNEEKRLASCLRSLAWADQVVVIDSFSEDRTLDIAEELADKVVQHRFANFSKQRNFALDSVDCPWVLFVDADEVVTPELAAEVRLAVIRHAKPPEHDDAANDCSAYWVPRHNLIWGKWIRHAGWHPDYQLRLLRVQSTRYDEQREVHEVAEVQGATGYLQNPLIHYNYDTVAQFITKQRAYSAHEARLLHSQGVRSRWRNYLGAPSREFFYRYCTLRGYRDGLHGLALSTLLAWYKMKTYVQLRKLNADAPEATETNPERTAQNDNL